jgi:uncharacterized membrane protein
MARRVLNILARIAIAQSRMRGSSHLEPSQSNSLENPGSGHRARTTGRIDGAVSMKHAFMWWDAIRTSLWFVPSLCVAVAIVLSFILPELDHFLEGEDITAPSWVFAGSADGARTILSTVAGSLVTIVGVLFSITIVVLQQASSQFTPRVMGNFIRQTGVQLTLGIYIATFLYSLLVLRYVRGEDAQAEEFIPRVSVSLALILAAICLGFLVYFIHHMATSLQASMVIANVNREFREDVEILFPEHIGTPANEGEEPLDAFRRQHMPVPTLRIEAARSGYVLNVDDDSLVSCAPETRGIAIYPNVGDFVTRGSPIIEIGNVRQLPDEQIARIRECVELGPERSRYQDPLFSIRQLVDIALKALSPGINDPTTAKNSISMLGDCLALLSTRAFPSQIRVATRKEDESGGEVHIWTNRPAFANYVDASFTEIQREAMLNASVTGHLIDAIAAIGDSISSPERAAPLHEELNRIQRGLDAADLDERDEAHLREQIDAARRRLLA